LILPERLAAITSLELKWDLELFCRPGNQEQQGRPDWRRTVDRDKVVSHLRCIGDACPNLRQLILTFTDLLYTNASVQPSRTLDEIDRVLLRPIAEAVASLPQPQKWPVVVELPWNVFTALYSASFSRVLGLEQLKRELLQDGNWLLYPLPGKGDEAAGNKKPSRRRDPKHRYDWDAEHYSYYFIKQGVFTSLSWNYLGNATLIASTADVGIGIIM
jgi:hypothetical protein